MIEPNTVKLLAFDLDGTLIASHQAISPFTKAVLSRLRARGILTTIATGRILPAVKSYADELEIDIPLILSNGGILQNRRGELTAFTALPLDVIQDTIRVAADLQRDLAEVRRRGWATDNEEFSRGILCFAAPVFDHRGVCVATIGTSVTTIGRTIDDVIRGIGPSVSQAAEETSRLLGSPRPERAPDWPEAPGGA